MAVINFGDLSLDTEEKLASISGFSLILSRRETDTLELLMRASGKAVSRAEIEAQIYSYEEKGSANSTEVLVRKLNNKFQNAGVEIKSAGSGYMITEP